MIFFFGGGGWCGGGNYDGIQVSHTYIYIIIAIFNSTSEYTGPISIMYMVSLGNSQRSSIFLDIGILYSK